MITQRVIAINDFGLDRRERTTSKGTTSRYTVEIAAVPLVHVFDPKTLGAGPANAIAEHLKAAVAAIGAEVSPATQLQRKYAATALAGGKAWAARRYAGGRMGAMPPNQSARAFNDSGRFAQSIVARATRDQNWVINVAANRLNPSTFRDGEAGVNRLFLLLRQHVPSFGDAQRILAEPSIREAIGDSLDTIFARQLGRSYRDNMKLRADVRRAQLGALRQGLSLLTAIGGRP